MRVAFVSHDMKSYVGGPNVWMRRLMNRLRDRGIETKAYLYAPEPGGEVEACLRADGLEVESRVGSRYTEERAPWLLERLRQDPPDVLVPNLMVAALYAAAEVRAAGIPTVGVLHSDDSLYRGILREFVAGEPAFRLSGIVAVSKYLEGEARWAARNTDTVVRRISYGVPLQKEPRRPENGPFRVAYYGRLVQKQKRVFELAAALCHAAAKVPGVEGVLYGDGAQREKLEKFLSEYAPALPVRVGGKVDNDRIWDSLAECHVTTLLSDYEGLPVGLLEAMAAGVVPVCLRINSGIPELVRHEETGLLVDDRREGFVSAIRRLKEDPALYARLSDGARREIARNHDEERCADDWADYLRMLAALYGGARRPIRTKPSIPRHRHEFGWNDIRHRGPEYYVNMWAYWKARDLRRDFREALCDRVFRHG